jgi:hypothetical protein
MYYFSGYGGSGKDPVAHDDQRGCFILIAGVLIVCVSAFLAHREIIYACFGRQAMAAVQRVFDVRGRTSSTTVIFEFTDAKTGKQRRESDQFRVGWRPPPGPLKVQYVPGSDIYVRVAGHTQQWSLWVFGASLAAAFVYIGMLIREANSPIRRSRRF